MRTLLIAALTATALLAGCSDADDVAPQEATSFLDPARAEAEAKALPAPVSLHVEGDVMGSVGQVWSWPIAEVTPSWFAVRFDFQPAMNPATGFVLYETAVRLVDPAGTVQGEYSTPFTAGEFYQSALEFQAPPYAAVTPGNWTVELSAQEGLAHYVLDVQVGYEPIAEEEPEAEAEAEGGTA